MRTLKLIAKVDEKHHLSASVPAEIPPGPVEIILTIHADNEDDAGAEWATGIAREWATELSDSREDIYTLNDGEPIDGRGWDFPREFSIRRQPRHEAAARPSADRNCRACSRSASCLHLFCSA